MINFRVLKIAFIFQLLVFSGCSADRENGEEVIKNYRLDNLDGLIAKKDVELDKDITSDGNGSLKITTDSEAVINLFETGDIDIENSRIVYKVKLKSEALEGEAYLEMWCSFSGSGEYFSRGLDSTISGTTDWIEVETPFFLRKGENPDNIKLNLVVNGKGTVWIDEIYLVKTTLEQ